MRVVLDFPCDVYLFVALVDLGVTRLVLGRCFYGGVFILSPLTGRGVFLRGLVGRDILSFIMLDTSNY